MAESLQNSHLRAGIGPETLTPHASAASNIVLIVNWDDAPWKILVSINSTQSF